MDIEVQRIKVPKSYYVQERKKLYSHPLESFWRENFQNSVDAGAKRIDITIEPAKGKGSFGRHRNVDNVIRIVFADDGHGMTEDVIDNVFFKPGESTKRDASGKTGGFGRARLLTAYSQVRYSLVTGDRAVEGDGEHFSHYRIDEMIEKLEAGAKALAETDPEDSRLAEIRAEADLLRGIAAKGPYKGLRLEVDMDPNEEEYRTWENPSIDSLLRALTKYLQMSQVPCKVFVNGEERKERLLRGPVKRVLVAKGEDGIERQFATVHTSQGEKANFKNQTIVRVDGAVMYANSISTDVQVIVELEPSMSRDVLTANRDGMREPYSSAYEALKNELVIDTRSALDDDALKHRTIEGTLGSMSARRSSMSMDIKSMPDMPSDMAREHVRRNRASSKAKQSPALSELEMNGYGGIPYAMLRRFFNEAYWGNSFLSTMGKYDLVDKISAAAAAHEDAQRVRHCIDALTEEEQMDLFAILLDKIEKDRAAEQAEFDRKLKGMPDVRISTEGDVKGKIRDAMRRNDPTKWDPAEGRGQKPRGILTAWTILCEEAIRTAMRSHEKAMPEEFEWTTGFLYAAPKAVERLNQRFQSYVTAAQHQKEDKKHFLLINPIDSDGVLRYDLNDAMDVQRMAMLAAHEVAHIAVDWHNEDFAALMTQIAADMDIKGASKRIKSALADIREIYKAGRVTSQPMDDKPGFRPAERLVAAMAPATTIAAGIMGSPENDEIDSIASAALGSSTQYAEDGTLEVDGARLDAFELAASSSFQAERDDDPGMTYR